MTANRYLVFLHLSLFALVLKMFVGLMHTFLCSVHLSGKKINIKGQTITGCCLSSDSKMVFSCYNANTVSFINKEGVELFQLGKDKTGCCTYDTVYIKDYNSVAVSICQLPLSGLVYLFF
jgi:hypothetical protein